MPEVLDRVKARHGQVGQFAVVAALEAWADAGYALPGEPTPVTPSIPRRLAVAIASGVGDVTPS